jgi:hypothetical protein
MPDDYIRFFVVASRWGRLEPVHPGALPFYNEAKELVKSWHNHTLAIIPESAWDAYTQFNADSICECGTERDLKEDDRGTYWSCPECDR